ncbi:hypothetical protein K5I29_04290 [Flavobacterium agricola]|uniref:Pentapeptide repeat-containing protein n=1 Tax=Flavobacterium agricola TaxID=2870839 RepID=A0ABY6M0S8_9FLAO|nr:hypothetical protein [Flavobacterium agricola]UYW02126.1 hypothetical protein K5I29_04290 [Flavobacterium agricola]
MNLIKKVIFSTPNLKPNTFIGGVASVINSKTELSNRLNISENNIKGFKVINNDIQFNIVGNLDFSLSAFANITTATYLRSNANIINVRSVGNSSFLYFNEVVLNSSLITEFRSSAFVNLINLNNFNLIDFKGNLQGYTFENSGAIGSDITVECKHMSFNNFVNAKFKKIRLPQLESMGRSNRTFYSQNFSGCQYVELISMRKLKLMYGNENTAAQGTYSNFAAVKLGCTIEVNIALATSWNGGMPPDLTFAKTNRQAIVKFYDDAGNYVSTL